MHKPIQTLLALGLALLSSCAAAAVSTAALVINEEFRNHSVTAVVPSEANFAWKSTLSTLSDLSTDMIDRDDNHMAARTKFDNATVTVHVAQYRSGETSIEVAAKQLMLYNDEVSRIVLDRIIHDLGNH